jgi:hypothetical protein
MAEAYEQYKLQQILNTIHSLYGRFGDIELGSTRRKYITELRVNYYKFMNKDTCDKELFPCERKLLIDVANEWIESNPLPPQKCFPIVFRCLSAGVEFHPEYAQMDIIPDNILYVNIDNSGRHSYHKENALVPFDVTK